MKAFKTHKTGGTTLTNVLLRYAEKHHLVTGLPFGDHWELAGYPAKFDKQLIDPILPKYNMMCHHFRNELEFSNYNYYFIQSRQEPSHHRLGKGGDKRPPPRR